MARGTHGTESSKFRAVRIDRLCLLESRQNLDTWTDNDCRSDSGTYLNDLITPVSKTSGQVGGSYLQLSSEMGTF